MERLKKQYLRDDHEKENINIQNIKEESHD